jgi:DNA-binding transcriptional ArsR family regulator
MSKRSPISRSDRPGDERVVQLGDGRRLATIAEAKAMAHPLRLRILRMCGMQELTNKQLADRLDRDPGTVLYHLRQLTAVGLLESAPVRTGASGALEKPYRATDQLRRLESTPALSLPGGALAPIQAFQEELQEAGPESVEKISRLVLHLSPAEAEELATRLVAIFDEYAGSDHERLDRPAHGGIFVLHRLAE